MRRPGGIADASDDAEMRGPVELKSAVAYDFRNLASYNHKAGGPVVPTPAKKHMYPPFVRAARMVLGNEPAASAIAPDLLEYMNRLLLQYTDSVIAAGDCAKLHRVPDEELCDMQIFGRKVSLLRGASVALTMRSLYLLKGIVRSRLSLMFTRKWVRGAVEIRVGSFRQQTRGEIA